MNKWSVRLVGKKFDLDELPQWFNSNEINITTEDGKFYLNSKSFNQDDDYKRIKNKAEGIILYINGCD